MRTEDTSGGCVNPDCLDRLTWYGAEGSGMTVSYVMRRHQPVAVIIKDVKRMDTPEHMHFSVEDFRLFAIALCSGTIPVPRLIDELGAHLNPPALPDPHPEPQSPGYCWRSWPPRHTGTCGCKEDARSEINEGRKMIARILTATDGEQ